MGRGSSVGHLFYLFIFCFLLGFERENSQVGHVAGAVICPVPCCSVASAVNGEENVGRAGMGFGHPGSLGKAKPMTPQC